MVKKLSLGRSIADKHEELKKDSENNEITKPEEKSVTDAISKIISSREEAIEQYDLTVKLKSGKYLLEKAYYNALSTLSKELETDMQEIASDYVLRSLKKDLEKYNISVRKK